MVIMSKKKGLNRAAIVMVAFILIVSSFGLFFFMSGGIGQQTRYPSELYTASDGEPPIFQNYLLNVTVMDKNENPLNNVFVIIFENNIAHLNGYTDEEGEIVFEMPIGDYLIQFEKYKYKIESEYLVFDESINLSKHMGIEEQFVLGIPSWLIMVFIGIGVLALAYFNRDDFQIGAWKKPKNWFEHSKPGSWTFIDKSTKAALYGLSLALLIVLIAIVAPNIPSLENMAYYYIVLGGVALVALLMEGVNRKYPIAAIGFGKKDALMGNIIIGASFALIFIGITGFASQLNILDMSTVNSIATIFVLVFVASFFEEAFYSGVLAPTLAEKTGIVPCILLTGIIFMLGHGLAYGWAFIPLIIAFAFREVATTIVLYRKSWIGVFVAHAIINMLSVFTFVVLAR